MMPQRAVPEIRRDLFAGIEPAMDRQIIFDRPAPFLHGRQRMVIRMCHRLLPQNTCWVYSEVSIRSLKLSVTVRSPTSKRKSPYALVDFPSAIGLLEEIVDQPLDRILD